MPEVHFPGQGEGGGGEGIPSLLTAYTPQIDILVTALLNTMNAMLLQVHDLTYTT